LRKVGGWQAVAVLALGVTWCLPSLPSTAATRPGASGRPDSPATRLQRLEDKDEIHDLLMAYGQLLDDGDWVGYSQLFARQGTWTGSFGTATGPAEILAMLRKSLGATPPHDPNHVRSFHLMTNCVIRVAGDRATATSRWTNFARTDDNKLTPRLAGHYVDVLVREDGKWKFLTRQAPRDIPNPETPAEAGKAP
jgi:3-phenylpropionate/cinnamic acid dioxygenase small subunit